MAAAAAPSTPGPDQAYYDKHAAGMDVHVVYVPGKGKGMFAKRSFAEGETVLEDHALVVAQDLDDRLKAIKICAHTMQSLETPAETFARVTAASGKPHPPPKKWHNMEKYLKQEHVQGVPCVDGCPLCFLDADTRAAADQLWHRVLCKGRMTKEQREAYEAFENLDWCCGGVDYSDSFHLMLHAVARILCSEGTVEERWYPYDLLAWAEWTELAASWATKTTKVTPGKLLDYAHKYMVAMFGGEAAAAIDLTKARVARLTGGILLNAQERSPESPFGRYLVWLEGKGVKTSLLQGGYDWRAKRPTDISNALYYSARAQGVYRTHSTTNHNCDPNTEVQYTDDMNEHLYMVALRDIAAGEEISISYIDAPSTKGYTERQDYLKTHYRFDCSCARCNEEGAKQAKARGQPAPAPGADEGGEEEVEETEEVEEEEEEAEEGE